eukprot:2726698-Pyramimonas_sp.AAC.1
MFMVPRHLKDHNSVSKQILPQRSVVAGSLNGGRLAKAVVGPALQRAQQRFEGRIMLRTFVDDAVLRVEGPERVVGDLLVESGLVLWNDLVSAGLK